MRVILNGKPIETGARTVAELCAALDYGDTKVATAVNLTFVPAAARAAAVLQEGDRVEIVSPRQGG
jgi:sulfur carrier protein